MKRLTDSNGALLVFATALLAFMVAAGGAVYFIEQFEDVPPTQVLLPLLVIYGVLALLLGLTFVIAVLAQLKLTDRNAALGLPEGSIRAVIALSLILVFVIVALHLYSTTDNAEKQEDLALQLLTTVGTLAVAVAGFYFGTQAITTATAAVAAGAAIPSTIRVWPRSPVNLPRAQGHSLSIVVETSPAQDEVRGEIVFGDDDGTIIQKEPGRFEYSRGSAAANLVLLAFTLSGQPGVVAGLEIVAEPERIPGPQSAPQS